MTHLELAAPESAALEPTADPRIDWTSVEGGHVSTIVLPPGSLAAFEVAFLADGEEGITREESFDLREDAAEYHAHLVVGLAAHEGLEPIPADLMRPDHPDAIRADDLRIKLLRAELDGNEPARIRILRELVTLVGADPDKMDLAAMPANRPAEVVSLEPRRADQVVRDAAAMLAVLWCAWGIYGCLRPISDATADLVDQAKRAAIYADHPGKVRQGLTPYQAGLAAERDLWLRPLKEGRP